MWNKNDWYDMPFCKQNQESTGDVRSIQIGKMIGLNKKFTCKSKMGWDKVSERDNDPWISQNAGPLNSLLTIRPKITFFL